MFKRVEKRRRKKEEEEGLGLDEEMKEIMGIHDTDSEESASDSEGSSGEEDSADEGMDLEAGVDMDGDIGLSGDEEEEDEINGEHEDPEVSVTQALGDPVYVVSVLPEVKACIVCPGKLLKGAKMVQLHRISNAHARRFKQFQSLSEDAEPTESAWEVLKRCAEEKPKLSLAPLGTGTSKRAEKRRAQQARRKLQRINIKEKKARKAAEKAAADSPQTISQKADDSLGKAPSINSSKSTDRRKKGTKKPKGNDKSTVESTVEDALSTRQSSPPKKKRKLHVQPEGDSALVIASTKPSSNPPKIESRPSSPTKKEKQQRPKLRKQSEKFPSTSPKDKSKPSTVPLTQEKVKSIVRSTADRAKTARSKATKQKKPLSRARG